MNRRSFLRTLALSAGGVALVGSELLVPGRTYFLPPAGGWAQNDIYGYLMRHGAILGGPDLVTDIYLWDWHKGELESVSVKRTAYQNFYRPDGSTFVSIQTSEWKQLGELT